MRTTIHLILVGAASGCAVFTAGAQTPSAQTDQAVQAGNLEEVFVTAQRRQERIQDVPVSISVLNGDELDSSTLQGITETLNRVAGVTTNVSPQGGGTMVTVRGVTAGAPLFDGSNPVAYYLDSVPFSLVDSAIAPDTNAYDLERVEVLRGPQGTLYGASALNGVVRVLTRDANLDAFEFKARTSVSSTEEAGENYRGDLAVNAPLVPGKVAVRAVAGYQDLSGWINKPNEKDANDSQVTNARIKINAQPTDRLAIGLSTWISRQDYGAPSIANDQGETFHLTDESTSVDYDSYGLTIEYDFPQFSLSSMTSYIDYQSRGRLDYLDFFGLSTPLDQDMEATVLSQEINLTSAGSGPWRWAVGAIYRDGDTQTIQALPDFAFTLDWTTTSKSYAMFGEVTRLFLDGRLEATFGARYFNDDVTVAEDKLVAPLVPPDYYHEKESFDSTTPRVVLTWHPVDRLTVYGSYAQGFRSGAPQAYYNRSGSEPGPPTQPDKLRNYEIGAKADLLDHRLSLDAAAYFIDWEGVHQNIKKEVQGICCVGQLVNGPPASGAGFDLGITTRPFKGLELGLSFSWNDLKFDEVVRDDAGLVQFAKGSRLSFSPEKTIGGFVDLAFPLGSGGLQARTGAALNYTSEQQWGGSTNLTPTDSSLVAGATFAIEARNWVATLFGDNLSNEQGRIYSNPADLNSINPASAARMRPRTIGLQLEYRF